MKEELDRISKTIASHPVGFLFTVAKKQLVATFWTDKDCDEKILAENLLSGLISNLTESGRLTKWQCQKIINKHAKDGPVAKAVKGRE